ncbi:uncharacterized protein [Physcomitrium patens]|uniref:uncharacterized protein isoform X10 n=1 Tax=Physcomitrium patens TaxID=3218 RepID=UPI003CCDBF01
MEVSSLLGSMYIGDLKSETVRSLLNSMLRRVTLQLLITSKWIDGMTLRKHFSTLRD